MMSQVIGRLMRLKWGKEDDKERYKRCPLYQPNRVYLVVLGRGRGV